MEESISSLCKFLSSFCNHVQSTSQALNQSLATRPIPLDSASSTFIRSLNRRISSAGPNINHLESMVLGTVSFHELLGHCNQVYEKNQARLLELTHRLHMFGYTPDDEVDDEDLASSLATPVRIDSKFLSPENAMNELSLSSPSISATASLRKRLEEDPLFDDSICLQNLGLSDVCLATLAAEANDELSSPKMLLDKSMGCNDGHPLIEKFQATNVYHQISSGEVSYAPKSIGSIDKCMIKITKDQYDQLPSYMKSLASWEDLQLVVEKMNSIVCRKEKAAEAYSFSPDDITSLELGAKGRSYLLMLLRMNRLVVETVGGSISYRVI